MIVESAVKTSQITQEPREKAKEPPKHDSIKIKRLFTNPNRSPFLEAEWELRSAKIMDDKGNVVFEQNGIQVPRAWSQLATNIVVSKYFRGHPGSPTRETSVAQVISRVVDTITASGVKQGYFDNPEDAKTFKDELAFIIINQMGTFNSPVWFNVGIVENPQSSACFVLPVEDSMDSILKLAHTEAMIFKGGSGTGTNLSSLRSSKEPLSGGGTASGPISFMKGFDAFTGAVKSGGKTRRAAKLVALDIDHPDILEFIQCKAKEEKKAWALIDAGYDGSMDGAAYSTVAFQNSNNSVRITDEFMHAVINDKSWETRARTTGEVMTTHDARELLMEIARSSHQCGDPGVQFDTTANKYNTCKNSGRINASNACGELQFLDNSACNLASINLLSFVNKINGSFGTFDIESFKHAVDVFITAQDIIVNMSSYPTPEITKNSKNFRPIGIGYTNLGATLMAMGLPYDSEDGRSIAASITALMTGEAYAQSARLAELLGPFAEYPKNKDVMHDVIDLHLEALNDVSAEADSDIYFSAHEAWNRAKNLGEHFGYRNAQVSLLAPTGTISFMMDCDTTGVEPDFSLVKTKNMVGGGVVKIHNKAVPLALQKLGYSPEERDEIMAFISENETIEGMPLLRREHLPVFDCAMKPANGSRCIDPMGHLNMVAAIQPFLSGAISKSINLPNSTTPEEIYELYVKAWQQGIKAITVYRDGSKRVQPLQTKETKETKPVAIQPAAQPVKRRCLPPERASITHKFSIAGHEGYVTVGQFEDGSPGELFIRMSKAGSVIGGLMDSLALAVSMALQYGVPLDVLVNKYSHTRFEPSGFTSNPKIPMATSLTDYIFRWLASKYLNDSDAVEIETAPSMPRQRLTDLSKLEKEPEMDGPLCPICGEIMRRTGTCFACSSCGTSGGCGG